MTTAKLKTDVSLTALLANLDERAAECRRDCATGRLTEDAKLDALDFLDRQRFALLAKLS